MADNSSNEEMKFFDCTSDAIISNCTNDGGMMINTSSQVFFNIAGIELPKDKEEFNLQLETPVFNELSKLDTLPLSMPTDDTNAGNKLGRE